MPIYEYRCGGCKKKFEQIILRGKALDEAVCPKCGSHDAERLLSSFSMSGVSRKSEESLDDDFDAPDEEFGDDEDDFGGAGFGGGDEGDGLAESNGGLDGALEDEDEA
jgi:putative FmdB family regulatory protein